VLPALGEEESPLEAPAGRQPLRIVDLPTAGLYPKGVYGFEMDLYSDGGLLVGVGVGIAGFASFGISYGGIEFIGSGNPEMNPRPEVNIRLRVLEEDVALPAVAVGFDSQGYGRYYVDRDSVGEERYLMKSRGLYAVASKNWEVVGPLSLHGGMSYSFENTVDDDPTVYVGLIKGFGDMAEFAVEYDLASNDNKVSPDSGMTEESGKIVQGRGILNASVSWSVKENLSLAFKVRDIAAKSRRDLDDRRRWNRGFSLTYRAEF
jgi:hypothetical protein